MAPEVIRNENYDESVDVYSFGMIAYYMFTSLQPFKGENHHAIARKVGKEKKSPPITEYLIKNEKIRILIDFCISHDPNIRPSFSSIVDILTTIDKR